MVDNASMAAYRRFHIPSCLYNTTVSRYARSRRGEKTTPSSVGSLRSELTCA